MKTDELIVIYVESKKTPDKQCWVQETIEYVQQSAIFKA